MGFGGLGLTYEGGKKTLKIIKCEKNFFNTFDEYKNEYKKSFHYLLHDHKHTLHVAAIIEEIGSFEKCWSISEPSLDTSQAICLITMPSFITTPAYPSLGLVGGLSQIQCISNCCFPYTSTNMTTTYTAQQSHPWVQSRYRHRSSVGMS